MPVPVLDVRISISYCAILHNNGHYCIIQRDNAPCTVCIATARFHCVCRPLQNVTLPAGNVCRYSTGSRWPTVIQEFKYCITVKFSLILFSSKGSKIRKDIKRQKSCIISCLIRKINLRFFLLSRLATSCQKPMPLTPTHWFRSLTTRAPSPIILQVPIDVIF